MTALTCPSPSAQTGLLAYPFPYYPPSPPLPSSQFAFARINGEVVLVQIFTWPETVSSALAAVDPKIFRHEFITIFRFSHCDSLHPTDVVVLEQIDDASTRYEEDSGTVFLARDVMERLQKITLAERMRDMQQRRRTSYPPRWR